VELYEEVKELRKLGLGITPIARRLHKCTDTIRFELVKMGELPERPVQPGGRKRKYTVNDNFFDEIDTEEKAYVLGFLFADGCISKIRNQVYISLHRKDKCILEKIKSVMCSDNPIFDTTGRFSKDYKITEKCSLNITSKRLVEKLELLGCVERKSDILVFPTISNIVVQHFMRGYFDGDGSVYKTNTNELRISVNSTKEFCDEYLNKLPYNGKATVRKEKRSKKNVYYFCIAGRNQVYTIYNFLYENATIFLNRKNLKFTEFYK